MKALVLVIFWMAIFIVLLLCWIGGEVYVQNQILVNPSEQHHRQAASASDNAI